MSGSRSIASLLLTQGADAEAADQDGITPLMAAAREGSGKLLRLLLEHGVAIDRQDHAGRTALMHAAGPAPELSLIGLRQRQYEADDTDDNARFLASAWRRRASAVTLLLEAGADPTIRDAAGKTAWDWAREQEGGQAVLDTLTSRD